MPNDHAASAPDGSTIGTSTVDRRGQSTLLSRFILSAVRRALGELQHGTLTLVLPTGAATTISGRHAGRHAHIRAIRLRAIWRALRRGKLGFAEAYMDGDLEIEDLEALFHLFIDNESALETSSSWLLRTRPADCRYHVGRENTREGSRRNIAAHYDLGNEFYRHWLDAGMSYSSAIYGEPGETLEVAQARKHVRIIEALDLRPGQTLLEIGCGWGSVMEAAALRGAHVKGITISAQQLDWTRQRLANAIVEAENIEGAHVQGTHVQGPSLAATTEVVFEDYRDTTGTFDRIVSVEMIEAVGEAHWPTYFQTLADRLKPGGSGIIQAITIPEPYFESYRTAPDFIQRYIFPGGMLPTVEAMRQHATAAGLSFSTVERFGGSYARTLRAWSARFNAAWPQIESSVFDERFRRMWNYYLSYCAVAFERDWVDVGLYRVAKPET